MNVTKQQIVNGTMKYINEEVINKITDRPLKIALAVGISMIDKKPEIINAFFDDDDDDKVTKILNKKDDGTYDIGEITEAIENTLAQYGDFPLTIPPIRFISPTEKILNFSAFDIRKLREYIEGTTT